MLIPSENTFEELIKCINNHCNDSHHKVAQSALGALARVLSLFPDNIEKFLHSLFMSVFHFIQLFKSVTESKEQVSSKANLILNLIQKIYSPDSLVNLLIKTLDCDMKPKMTVCSLEILAFITPLTKSTFTTYQGVRVFVLRIVEMLSESLNRTQILEACVHVIISLKEKSKAHTLSALASLNPNLLSNTITVCSKFCPELEKEISDEVTYKKYRKNHKSEFQKTKPKEEQNDSIISERIDKLSAKDEEPLQIIRQPKVFSIQFTNQICEDLGKMQTLISQLEKSDPDAFTRESNALFLALIRHLDSGILKNQKKALECLSQISKYDGFLKSLQTPSIIKFFHLFRSIEVCVLNKSEELNTISEKLIDTASKITLIKALLDELSMQNNNFHSFNLAFLSKILSKAESEHVIPFLEHLFDQFMKLINDPATQVRKNVVDCIVCLYNICGKRLDTFTKKFSPNQQKLIEIYIEKSTSNNFKESVK